MLTDLDAPALPRRYWSWQKLLFWLIGIACLLVSLIFTYDGKLEPYDDLLPLRTTVPGASTNGYEFLAQAEADPGDHNRLLWNCRYLKWEALVRVHAGDFPGALLILRDL